MVAWLLRCLFAALLVLGLARFHQTRSQRPLRIDVARQEGRLILGNGTEPATMDPSIATGVPEHHVFDALFEGLTAGYS